MKSCLHFVSIQTDCAGPFKHSIIVLFLVSCAHFPLSLLSLRIRICSLQPIEANCENGLRVLVLAVADSPTLRHFRKLKIKKATHTKDSNGETSKETPNQENQQYPKSQETKETQTKNSKLSEEIQNQRHQRTNKNKAKQAKIPTEYQTKETKTTTKANTKTKSQPRCQTKKTKLEPKSQPKPKKTKTNKNGFFGFGSRLGFWCVWFWFLCFYWCFWLVWFWMEALWVLNLL